MYEPEAEKAEKELKAKAGYLVESLNTGLKRRCKKKGKKTFAPWRLNTDFLHRVFSTVITSYAEEYGL